MTDILNNIIYMARRFKTATTLNLIGLVLAFATFYLLMTQFIYQITYNHDVEDYERLYRLECNYLYNEEAYNDNVCLGFTYALDSMPLVESYSVAVNVNNADYTLRVQKEDSVLEIPYTWGNNTVISALTSRTVDGSIEWEKDNTEGIIIPASIAQDCFGTTQAAGKELKTLWQNDTVVDYKVLGVYEDFPENSELWNCIYSRDNQTAAFNTEYKCIIKFAQVPDDMTSWTDSLKQVILQLAPKLLQEQGEAIKEIDTEIKNLQVTDFRLTPLGNSYFENSSFSFDDHRGYRAMLLILIITSFIVLFIASINFLNFTLAESPMRVRSLNTRLVLGAQRHALRSAMVSESVIVAIIACLIAIAICALLTKLPSSAQFISDHLFNNKTLPLIPIMLVVAVVVGLVAGIYPAKFATSFPLAFVLKGTFGLTPQGIKLRTAIVGLQLFFSMLTMSYLSILFLQTDYIYHSDYGYNKDQILINSLPSTEANDTLREKLMNLSGVKEVSFSDALLGATDTHNPIMTSSQDHNITFRYIIAEVNYLQTMGIGLAEGRYFSPDDATAVIINEAARQQWHWLGLGDKLPLSLLSTVTDSATIVGVCKDIRYGTTRISNDKPFVFVLDRDNIESYLNQMNVLIAPNADKEHVRQQVSKMVMDELKQRKRVQDAVYFDKILEKTYKNELQYINMMVIISIICMIITLIGVFCLTMFDTEYRSKEIAIRKVSGATTGEIVTMLCRRYGWIILISFAASIPVALFCGYLTLNDYFAQHTSIKWWVFPLTLLVVGGVTLITVALKSWRTARKNPTASIRTE